MVAETEILKPLVSFCLFAYNQEPFIREAVAGALAQIYSPLEIILSDDCSTDRTYAIMEEMAAAYQGPHRVILNRTPENQGVARHIDLVVKQSSGSWIVSAAGDDVSCATRVSRLMEIAAEHPGVCGLCSGWKNIDQHGNELPPDDDHQGCAGLVRIARVDFNAPRFVLHGAATAYRKEIYTQFGPIRPDVFHDDMVLTFRGLLLGDVVAFPDELVLYRRWSGSASAGSNNQGESHREKILLREKRSARWHKSLAASFKQMRSDFSSSSDVRKPMPAEEIRRLEKEIGRNIHKHANVGLWSEYSFGVRLFKILAHPQYCAWTVPRLFGIEVYAGVYSFLRRR